ncbi:polymerase delta-interacting protein 3-like isoform X2 [Branchiostoma lanceolatum]|uniref:polymerase delta-interacting protein 3-like isoform X2 n=1 Tax=Branchiostoma lanceolatum TaxID=7740 RepID=UPI0034564001
MADRSLDDIIIRKPRFGGPGRGRGRGGRGQPTRPSQGRGSYQGSIATRPQTFDARQKLNTPKVVDARQKLQAKSPVDAREKLQQQRQPVDARQKLQQKKQEKQLVTVTIGDARDRLKPATPVVKDARQMLQLKRKSGDLGGEGGASTSVKQRNGNLTMTIPGLGSPSPPKKLKTEPAVSVKPGGMTITMINDTARTQRKPLPPPPVDTLSTPKTITIGSRQLKGMTITTLNPAARTVPPPPQKWSAVSHTELEVEGTELPSSSDGMDPLTTRPLPPGKLGSGSILDAPGGPVIKIVNDMASRTKPIRTRPEHRLEEAEQLVITRTNPVATAPKPKPAAPAPKPPPAPAKVEEEEAEQEFTSPLQGTKIAVSNLHPVVSENDVIELFSDLGPLKRARLIKQGTAEVVYVRREDAINAYKKYHNRDLDSQPMKLTLHLPSNPPPTTPTSAALEHLKMRAASSPPATQKPLEINTIHRALFKSSAASDPATPSKPVVFTVKI